MKKLIVSLALAGIVSGQALAQEQTLTAQERAEISNILEETTKVFLDAVERGEPLTDLSKSCPEDAVAKDPEYYSDNPETQKYCVANPCHCF